MNSDEGNELVDWHYITLLYKRITVINFTRSTFNLSGLFIHTL